MSRGQEPQKRRLPEWEDKRARRQAEFTALIPAIAAQVAAEVSAAVSAALQAARFADLQAKLAADHAAAAQPSSVAGVVCGTDLEVALPTICSSAYPGSDTATAMAKSNPASAADDSSPISALVAVLPAGVVRGGDLVPTSPTTCSSLCPGGDMSSTAASEEAYGTLAEAASTACRVLVTLTRTDDLDEGASASNTSAMEPGWATVAQACPCVVRDHLDHARQPCSVAMLTHAPVEVVDCAPPIVTPSEGITRIAKAPTSAMPLTRAALGVHVGSITNEHHRPHSVSINSVSLFQWDPGEKTRASRDPVISQDIALGACVKQLKEDSGRSYSGQEAAPQPLSWPSFQIVTLLRCNREIMLAATHPWCRSAFSPGSITHQAGHGVVHLFGRSDSVLAIFGGAGSDPNWREIGWSALKLDGLTSTIKQCEVLVLLKGHSAMLLLELKPWPDPHQNQSSRSMVNKIPHSELWVFVLAPGCKSNQAEVSNAISGWNRNVFSPRNSIIQGSPEMWFSFFLQFHMTHFLARNWDTTHKDMLHELVFLLPYSWKLTLQVLQLLRCSGDFTSFGQYSVQPMQNNSISLFFMSASFISLGWSFMLWDPGNLLWFLHLISKDKLTTASGVICLQDNSVHEPFFGSAEVDTITKCKMAVAELQPWPSWEKSVVVLVAVRTAFDNFHSVVVPLRIMGEGTIRLHYLGKLYERQYSSHIILMSEGAIHYGSLLGSWFQPLPIGNGFFYSHGSEQFQWEIAWLIELDYIAVGNKPRLPVQWDPSLWRSVELIQKWIVSFSLVKLQPWTSRVIFLLASIVLTIASNNCSGKMMLGKVIGEEASILQYFGRLLKMQVCWSIPHHSGSPRLYYCFPHAQTLGIILIYYLSPPLNLQLLDFSELHWQHSSYKHSLSESFPWYIACLLVVSSCAGSDLGASGNLTYMCMILEMVWPLDLVFSACGNKSVQLFQPTIWRCEAYIEKRNAILLPFSTGTVHVSLLVIWSRSYHAGHCGCHQFTSSKVEVKERRNAAPAFHGIKQFYIGHDYFLGIFLEEVHTVCYLNLAKVCLDYGTHRDLGDVTKHQVPWDPGCSTWHRLEVKPKIKEGGMLATILYYRRGLDHAPPLLGLGFSEAKGGSGYLYERIGYDQLGLGRMASASSASVFFLL